jgi:hypothetical protein
MHRYVGAWVVVMLLAGSCSDTSNRPEHTGEVPDAGGPPSQADGGTSVDGGLPGGGGSAEAGPGPWPDEPVVDYSRRYALGRVQSVGVDEAYNLWLLDGERIGVLRPGDSEPRWTSGVGQAAGGFGPDRRALGSTVICGGSAGRAYVGYAAAELALPFIYSPDGANFPLYNDPDPSRFDPLRYEEYQKGDMDVVRLEGDGRVVLEERLQRSVRPNGPQDIGIRNTNDHHFDEDRTVLTCVRVMQGPHRGELYIGTNHGVTRIRSLHYNSHRHPVWFAPGGSQRAGYNYALGISQSGDVLIGNEWMVGIVTPSSSLADWDRMDPRLNPEPYTGHVPELNGLEEMDYWRGFQQTVDGRYYLASERYGLWELEVLSRSSARSTRVAGLPTAQLTVLAATGDGSLFIGTQGEGLWRMSAQRQLERVQGIRGSRVRQLLYDPTVQPAMLYVLTEAGLTVLRGY